MVFWINEHQITTDSIDANIWMGIKKLSSFFVIDETIWVKYLVNLFLENIFYLEFDYRKKEACLKWHLKI